MRFAALSPTTVDNSAMDENRKRNFVYLLFAVGIPVIVILGLADWLEGDLAETVMNAVLLLTLIISAFTVHRFGMRHLFIQVGLLVITVTLLYGAAIGAGDGSILYWTFALPLFYFFFLGPFQGMVWSISFAIGAVCVLLDPLAMTGYVYTGEYTTRFLFSFLFIVIVSFGLESSRAQVVNALDERNATLRMEKERLETALTQIKTLSGLLPICANCKKIRDDGGYWHDVAVYVRDHTEADFSHSICPDCVVELYGTATTIQPQS
ncbi:MAG: hypothetical protein KDD78_19035 [Caldilineaceae bacterium]|nr:hypothetical protein [Caldilineaceae bacterium]